MIHEISDNLKKHKKDDKVKVILVRAESKGFCAGMYLNIFSFSNH